MREYNNDLFEEMTEDLTDDQYDAAVKMAEGRNVFITGAAGSGKSTLIDTMMKFFKVSGLSAAIVAPTGIAALNVGGSTIHSYFGLGANTPVMAPVNENSYISSTICEKIKSTDVLIFEEISMVRRDMFEFIMSCIMVVKPSLQVIVVGDFYQLPPVIRPEDRNVLKEMYNKNSHHLAFESPMWKQMGFETCKLTSCMRQQNDLYFAVYLDRFKRGITDSIRWINDNCAKTPFEDAIWIVGKNATARDINYSRLEAIDAEPETFSAEYTGNCTEKDNLCEDILKIKVGARVVMTVNAADKSYYNGSMGTITAITNWYIRVDIDHGTSVCVEPHIFCKYEYVADKETKKLERRIAGTARQYPMKLGYAVTVHKAQGQTYEKANFLPEIFEDGQAYVAMSRCVKVENLYIKGGLKTSDMRTVGGIDLALGV